MKISMNGLRRNMSGNVESLRDAVQAVVSGGHYDKQELVEAMNQVISASNILNCCYDENDPDFADMGDIQVDFIEDDDDGEAMQ